MKAYFEVGGAVRNGEYFAGHYSWPVAMRLVVASVRGKPPAGKPVTIGLEVGGEMTAKRIYLLPSSAGGALLEVPLGISVPADAEVRWKVLNGPEDETKLAGDAAIAMEAVPAVEALSMDGPIKMFVRWVNSHESLDLFDYNPITRAFTERTAGLATGRATIVNATNFTVTLQSTVAMQIAGGVTMVNDLSAAVDSGLAIGPRLEFWRENANGTQERLARLTKAGVLFVPEVEEVVPAADMAGQFEFLGGGLVKAAIGGGGLVAADLREGIL
jgi:hypothetical protein